MTRCAAARIRSRRCIAGDVTREAVAEAYGTCPTAAGLGAAPSALSARRALEWLDEVELSETYRHVARLILREISERLQFL